ncbi:MAG: hypothetical protein Q8K79_22580 [Solirubrobacteraceae bacterium]|nr:hypothetical protein [Solirubrobacteraceae bacterium]
MIELQRPRRLRIVAEDGSTDDKDRNARRYCREREDERRDQYGVLSAGRRVEATTEEQLCCDGVEEQQADHSRKDAHARVSEQAEQGIGKRGDGGDDHGAGQEQCNQQDAAEE